MFSASTSTCCAVLVRAAIGFAVAAVVAAENLCDSSVATLSISTRLALGVPGDVMSMSCISAA